MDVTLDVRKLKPRMARADHLLGCLESFLYWWGEVQDDGEQRPFDEVWEEFSRLGVYSTEDQAVVKDVAQRFLQA